MEGIDIIDNRKKLLVKIHKEIARSEYITKSLKIALQVHGMPKSIEWVYMNDYISIWGEY